MKVQNTLTRTLDEVTSLEDKKIKLYTCGLTVYSQPHIGNWVAYIYWDVLVRTLKDAGYDVTRVQNITDVGHLTSDEDAGEDKMLKGALTEGITAWQVAEKYIAIADDEAYNKLGLLRPDHMPRATEYIPQQIAFVEELEKRGYTYTIADGVYFDTSKLTDYGKLARLDIEGLQFGARVADTGKKNPTDFAVWKFSDPTEKRDMEWDSPWGKGFPGWHLECSVMARELLGDQIDIHTGGIDHIPVHHTNEIAQTEAVTSKQFSQIWMHANHIKVNGEKMSKSLGNIYTLQDIVDKGFDLQAFKLMVLSKHYSTEGNFTWEILQAAQNRLVEWQACADLRFQTVAYDEERHPLQDLELAGYMDGARQALENDLNTPEALIKIYDGLEQAKLRNVDKNAGDAFIQYLKFIRQIVGIDLLQTTDITEEQELLIKERQEARDDKNWEISDRLRDQLLEQGIEIRDTQHGQIWYRV
jgi:cysteinyl-tRNA synthetase